jgi:hypothetical protein
LLWHQQARLVFFDATVFGLRPLRSAYPSQASASACRRSIFRRCCHCPKHCATFWQLSGAALAPPNPPSPSRRSYTVRVACCKQRESRHCHSWALAWPCTVPRLLKPHFSTAERLVRGKRVRLPTQKFREVWFGRPLSRHFTISVMFAHYL